MKKGINAAIAAILVLAVAGAGYYAYSYNASGIGKRGHQMRDGQDFGGGKFRQGQKNKKQDKQDKATSGNADSGTHL